MGKSEHFYCLSLRFYCAVVKFQSEYAYKGYAYQKTCILQEIVLEMCNNSKETKKN